jgi:hypothetical protein
MSRTLFARSIGLTAVAVTLATAGCLDSQPPHPVIRFDAATVEATPSQPSAPSEAPSAVVTEAIGATESGTLTVGFEPMPDAMPQQRRVLVTGVNVEVIVTVNGKKHTRGFPGYWIQKSRHAFDFPGLPAGQGEMQVVIHVGMTAYPAYSQPVTIQAGKKAEAIDLYVSQDLLAGRPFAAGMIQAKMRGPAAPAPTPTPTGPTPAPTVSPSGPVSTPTPGTVACTPAVSHEFDVRGTATHYPLQGRIFDRTGSLLATFTIAAAGGFGVASAPHGCMIMLVLTDAQGTTLFEERRFELASYTPKRVTLPV